MDLLSPELWLDPKVWFGAVLGIPFSIFSALVLPRVQTLLARRSADRSHRRTTQLLKELEEIRRLAGDSSKHQIFLLESVLFITLMTTGLAVLIGFFYLVGTLGGGVIPLLFSRGMFVAGSMMVAAECVSTLRKSARIRNFAEYQAKANSEVSRLGS